MAHVCITGNEQSPAALIQRLERVLKAHPRVLCELRLDYLDLSPPEAFHFLARLPAEMAPRLVLTQRLKVSGGGCNWDVLTWQSWWRDVMALRPWFAADLDWLVLDRIEGEALSWRGKFRARHAFFSLHGSLAEVAETLPFMVAAAREQEAGVKIACPVESARDLAQLADLSAQCEGLPIRVAAAMGPAGRAWRWSRLSGDLTYFAAMSGSATAPGQDSFSSVLPYLSSKKRPDLFLLLGENAENRYGEERWNRAFLRRGARARYVNCPNADAAGALWAENALRWMSLGNVKGASITKPFKLSFPSPTNTLKRLDNRWERANTDGPAVAALLERAGVGRGGGARVVIAGGGGAARAAEEGLRAEGYEPVLWVREEGRLGLCPAGEALISTWPGEFQAGLLAALPAAPGFRVVVDAQFSHAPTEAPLARWAAAQNIIYLPGGAWWKEQARGQDALWFGPERLGDAQAQILAQVPASKSETLRALALGAATGLPTEIHGPALNEDTEVFVRALEQLGVLVDKDGGATWRLFSPKSLVPPAVPIAMGEGATGLRILGALSVLMEERPLLLSGAGKLQERPADELTRALGLGLGRPWPLCLPPGGALPDHVSLEQSSQFATGFLIAAAGALHRGKIAAYTLRLEGELHSTSYVELTLALLREAGIEVNKTDREISLRLGEKKSRLVFRVEKDASSLAFLEVLGRRWGLGTFFTPSRQGDGAFPSFLRCLDQNQPVNLKDHPDLAPPLWAAAALLRRRLEINGAPHLRWKESDRAELLVRAARTLGATAEERGDGFVADFRRAVFPAAETFLQTGGDHRMAMAFGLVGTDYPQVSPDRRDCVRKSFPLFWQALQLFEEALPG